jgi:hypothetical protein
LGDLKRCTKCGAEKPAAEFSHDRSRKHGRYSQCKAWVRHWRQENAERLAEYNRRWAECESREGASRKLPLSGANASPTRRTHRPRETTARVIRGASVLDRVTPQYPASPPRIAYVVQPRYPATDVRPGFLHLARGSFGRGDAPEQGPEESDIEDEGRLVLAVPPPRSAAQAIPLPA